MKNYYELEMDGERETVDLTGYDLWPFSVQLRQRLQCQIAQEPR